MKGKRLSIEDLERLANGTRVSIDRGLCYRDYIVNKTLSGELYLTLESGSGLLCYPDILKLDIYECVRETAPVIRCNMVDQSNYKPEMRVIREFNIAKKKENEVSKRSRQEKLQYIIAVLKIRIDEALEQMNESRFITSTGRLNKLRQACEVG